jgi:hypothetical protein
MWKRLSIKFKFFLLILLAMCVLAGVVYLTKYGNPFIGIPMWLLFAFLIFGGWHWIKDDKKNALLYIIMILVIYLIIIYAAIRNS